MSPIVRELVIYHEVFKLGAFRVRVELHALCAAAQSAASDGGNDEWTAYHGRVRAQGEDLEDVRAGADASVHDNCQAAADSGAYLGQHLGRSLGGGDDAAAVRGDDDTCASGLGALHSALGGHDALGYEGDGRIPGYFGQVGNRLGAELAAAEPMLA